MSDSGDVLNTTTVLWRGICQRCPKCGQGMLFKSYLKQNENCAVCGENLSRFRAEDGPAWLTILITGHIVVPALIYITIDDLLPVRAATFLMGVATVGLALAILPRSKGGFISILWLLARKKKLP